ncbi:DUF3164 family protein [Paludibacter sp.]|uniref:DUF3164 family protein n=1 Tax=Paludibacter sp. TaxID=1898105 RepID=UPI0013554B2F|nr:DUF3164 family protein [Paludibacter sp.]MTK53320.1 DUF3164 family protein [Paludibacter sp.]
MDIKNLTPEEKASLKAQLAAEEKADKIKAQQDKQAYKALMSDFVEKFFPKLTQIASDLTLAKADLFESAAAIFELKKQVFNISAEAWGKQQSHDISNADYSKTITLGFNYTDGWDIDVTNAGVSRINDWLSNKIKEGNQESFVNITRALLKPDKNGVLKASRILDLANQAKEYGDQELIEAVQMIQEAYRPERSSTYILAKYKDENGKKINLQLSMSQA